MKLKEKEKINLESVVEKIVENPLDKTIYTHIKKVGKGVIEKKLGIKERENLEKDMSETLRAMEVISEEEREDEEMEKLEKVLEGEEGLEEIDDNDLRNSAKVFTKNKDIAKLFFTKHMEFAGKKGNLIREYRKISKDKKIKKLIKSLNNSRFYSLLLLINRADPLEVEAILSKLLPAMIQAGLSESGIKEVVNSLMVELDKGKISNSKNFFRKLNSVVRFLNLFGGSKELSKLLRGIR